MSTYTSNIKLYKRKINKTFYFLLGSKTRYGSIKGVLIQDIDSSNGITDYAIGVIGSEWLQYNECDEVKLNLTSKKFITNDNILVFVEEQVIVKLKEKEIFIINKDELDKYKLNMSSRKTITLRNS
jgi:hypothetical protein